MRNDLENLDELAIRYESCLQIIRQLQKHIHKDKGLALEIIAALKSPKSALTVFEMIQACFVEQQNKWCTMGDLQRWLGLRRNCISQVVYKNKKSEFEHRLKHGYVRMQEWRLVNAPEGCSGLDESDGEHSDEEPRSRPSPLKMDGLSVDDALRGAMEVDPRDDVPRETTT